MQSTKFLDELPPETLAIIPLFLNVNDLNSLSLVSKLFLGVTDHAWGKKVEADYPLHYQFHKAEIVTSRASWRTIRDNIKEEIDLWFQSHLKNDRVKKNLIKVIRENNLEEFNKLCAIDATVDKATLWALKLNNKKILEDAYNSRLDENSYRILIKKIILHKSIDEILKHQADNNLPDGNVMYLSIKHGHIELMKYFYAKKIFHYNSLFSVMEKEQTVLEIACEFGHLDVCRYLLDEYFSSDNQNINFLNNLFQYRYLTLIRYCIEKQLSNPDHPRVPLFVDKVLHLASEGCLLNIIEYIIARGEKSITTQGIPFNSKNGVLMALQLAEISQKTEIVEFLFCKMTLPELTVTSKTIRSEQDLSNLFNSLNYLNDVYDKYWCNYKLNDKSEDYLLTQSFRTCYFNLFRAILWRIIRIHEDKLEQQKNNQKNINPNSQFADGAKFNLANLKQTSDALFFLAKVIGGSLELNSFNEIFPNKEDVLPAELLPIFPCLVSFLQRVNYNYDAALISSQRANDSLKKVVSAMHR